jgi:[ribosomal protein S5]-alanine N-acetyltransferase
MLVCETERLYLREWVHDDWKRFKPLATDPRVLRYIGAGTPWTDEQIKARIARWIELGRERGWILWPVIHREDAELIGFCGFWDGFAPDVEIGWRLRPDYWGQGLATEAATAVMEHGFQHYRFHRLISVAQIENKPSIRIMEKLGMEFERAFVHEGFQVLCYARSNPLFTGSPKASEMSSHSHETSDGFSDDGSLLAAFESCTYPLEQWNHRAHIRVAFLYLSRCGLDQAIDRMRSGIQAYNAVHGVEDGPETGYHETTTQAFMRLIHNAIKERGPFQDSHQFCDGNPELLDRRVLLRYYTRDQIMTPEAKARFVEPDLAPLFQ